MVLTSSRPPVYQARHPGIKGPPLSVNRRAIVEQLLDELHRDAPGMLEKRRRWLEAAERGDKVPYLRTLLGVSESLFDRVLGKAKQHVDVSTGPLEVTVKHSHETIDGVGLDE